MPTDGSLSSCVELSGTVRTFHVAPLSVDSANPCWPPQSAFGTYAVPSGPTLMWPWRPPAREERVHGDPRAERGPAGDGLGGRRLGDGLRAVVHRVGIHGVRQRRGKRAPAHGLVVHGGAGTAPQRVLDPRAPVVVAERHEAAGQVELRDER